MPFVLLNTNDKVQLRQRERMHTDFKDEFSTPPTGGRTVKGKGDCQRPLANQSEPSQLQAAQRHRQDLEVLPDTTEAAWFSMDVGRTDVEAARKGGVSMVAKRLLGRMARTGESRKSSETSHSMDGYMCLERDSQEDGQPYYVESPPSHHHSSSDFGSGTAPLQVHLRPFNRPLPSATPIPRSRYHQQPPTQSGSLLQIYPSNRMSPTPEEKHRAIRYYLHSSGFV
eukprot:gb/GEZN01010190.1/.p1 GENE.gb/GEZN01010190.1/~~gb/GEZN01010190.1/.p1  ORF type:complete len:226 (+),score=13.84 gb/GEZN01010190.1/:76-753(+)